MSVLRSKPMLEDSPLSLAAMERTLKTDSMLTLKGLVDSRGSDLSQALSFLRNRDLLAAEEVTRRKMVRMGRCPVCTLALPCRHYKDKKDLPREEDTNLIGNESKSSVIVNITSDARGEGNPLLTPTLSTRLTPSPRRAHDLTVRFRSPGRHSFKPLNQTRSHSHNEGRRVEERRLRLLEKLDRYREERLRREIGKLEELKKREEEERRLELLREQKRLGRQQVLKQQLADYQERLLREQEERKKQYLANSHREKVERRKRQAQMEKQVSLTQKLLISDFHHKAEIINSIQRDQVSSLGTSYPESEALQRLHAD